MNEIILNILGVILTLILLDFNLLILKGRYYITFALLWITLLN